MDDPTSFVLRKEMRRRLGALLKQYGATMVPRFRA
jgi:hypothetical protein